MPPSMYTSVAISQISFVLLRAGYVAHKPRFEAIEALPQTRSDTQVTILHRSADGRAHRFGR